MKIKEFKQAFATVLAETGTAAPVKEPKVRPGIAPTPEKRPNPFMPPQQAPKTTPKAFFTESEDQTLDKISQRYSSLKEGKKK